MMVDDFCNNDIDQNGRTVRPQVKSRPHQLSKPIQPTKNKF